MLEINQRLPLEDAAVCVRTLDRGDVPLLETLHQHVSSNSLYYRYFCSYRPTLAELHHMCRQDDKGAGYIAVVETPTPTVIGVAHYVIAHEQQPLIAEPAFLIADHFQGQGFGRLLFQQLRRHARAQGVHAFHAYVHPANQAMMQVFRRSGLPITVQMAHGMQEVQIRLEGEPVHPRRFYLN